ncbi:GNAT family N-acetyltransferase [Extibacter muris]|uniref:GNAT family N-acetyltransferase n=1 Tax=Extibacter muris TaxID=1796622 RepID=A0A4R4FDL0_9FIRM|nr:GNAT family N-acetyltransferase [Extibacter muris]MCU0081467.1 GNAT family N-acetyltransferase [Extibacter muris]TDA20839.1 GNAT family N-acetyltransferase [Extibacter muris]
MSYKSVEGVQSFRAFIEDKEIIQTLEFWGAYDYNELKGVIATNENRKHICCFFVIPKYSNSAIKN